mmetsp:Transcript_136042/g.339268  ORF Transcript_136042/g.339268 Transcript_136042/m.339268 type:complete len:203 (-) Transcript_136042:31-639(-)
MLVQVWPFHEDPTVACAAPQVVPLACQAPTRQIQLLTPDLALATEVGLVRDVRANIPDSAVVIKENVRVDTRGALNDVGLRPRATNVACGDDKVRARPILYARRAVHARGDDVKRSVPVPQRGRLDAVLRHHICQVDGSIHLLLTVQTIADQCPIEEIPAVMDRKPWEVLEGRVGQVKVVAYAANGGVREAARQDRVRKGHW